jgi:nitrogen fixation protein FixH
VSATSTTLATGRLGERRLRGWHVLFCLVGFFGIVIAVNGAMIYAAIATYSGVVASEPYRKGLHYNDRVQAGERQQRLRWQDVLSIDRNGQIVLTLAGADGRAINGLDIQIVVGRPSTNRHDVKVPLSADAPGHYAARIAPLPSGSWIASVEARLSGADADPVFRARRRLWMAP